MLIDVDPQGPRIINIRLDTGVLHFFDDCAANRSGAPLPAQLGGGGEADSAGLRDEAAGLLHQLTTKATSIAAAQHPEDDWL